MSAFPAVPYFYPGILCFDPVLRTPIALTATTWHAESDDTYAAPIELWDPVTRLSLGDPTTLVSSDLGFLTPVVSALPDVVIKAGDYVTPYTASKGAREAAEAARDAAQAAQAAAEQAVASGSGIANAPSTWPQTFPPDAHSHRVTDLRRELSNGSVVDLSTQVMSLLVANDAQAARAAIGAGTSSQVIQLGYMPGMAMPGDATFDTRYYTKTQIDQMLASMGGGGAGGIGNVYGWKYASGAWPTIPATVTTSNTAFILASGPTSPAPGSWPTGIPLIFIQE